MEQAKVSNGRIIKHYRDERWAVEFIHTDGGRYRTSFTTWPNEAEGWLAIVNADGWPMSARPSRASTRWEDEDFVQTYRRAA